MRKRFSAITVTVIAMMLVVPAVIAASSTVIVTSNDVGVSWFTADTRTGGSVAFVDGPPVPPLGDGSLEMRTTDANGSGQAKAQFFNYSYMGASLARIIHR